MNNFNDHLNFTNNIYDNLFVRNQVEYYKNLSEQLQAKVDLLEAGMKKAMRSGNSERLKKEAIRQAALQQSKEQLSARANLRADQLLRSNPSRAGSFALMGQEAGESARQRGENIEEIEMQLGVENPEAYRETKQAMSRMIPHSSNATY